MTKYGSHAPALAYCLSECPAGSNVAEFGAGQNSTPMFNLFAHARELHVTTFESDAGYLAYARQFTSALHCAALVTRETLQRQIRDVAASDPAFVFIDSGWLSFIDANGATCRVVPRSEILRGVIDSARIVLCHDTEPGKYFERVYAWDFSGARYVKHFEDFGVRTTLLSNFVDVSKIHYVSAIGL